MPFRAHRGKQLVGLSGQRRILGFSGHAIAVELNALGQFANLPIRPRHPASVSHASPFRLGWPHRHGPKMRSITIKPPRRMRAQRPSSQDLSRRTISYPTSPAKTPSKAPQNMAGLSSQQHDLPGAIAPERRPTSATTGRSSTTRIAWPLRSMSFTKRGARPMPDRAPFLSRLGIAVPPNSHWP